MHHAISYHLAQARLADLRHDARRAALARAARPVAAGAARALRARAARPRPLGAARAGRPQLADAHRRPGGMHRPASERRKPSHASHRRSPRSAGRADCHA